MRLATFMAMVCLLSVAAHVPAADWHVNNVAGDDHWDGMSPVSVGAQSGPFRTIGRALREAQKSDRIYVANTGQPYRESITLQAGRHSGTSLIPFLLVGNGAVLDGTAAVPAEAWQFVKSNVWRFRPRRLNHQVVYLDDKPLSRREPEEGLLPDLQPLEWSLLNGFVYLRTEAGRRPQEYEFYHSALPVGIGLYEVRHVEVRDFVVQGYQLDGVNAHDGVFDTQLVGLTSRGNGRSGISVGGASRVRIESCLVGSNAKAQVRTEGYSHTQLVNCDLIDGPVPAVDRTGGEVQVVRQ